MKNIASLGLLLLPGVGLLALFEKPDKPALASPVAVPAAARPPDARHTRVYVEIAHQGLDVYVRDSDAIVRGFVTGQRPVFPEKGLAYTEIDLWAFSTLKGPGPRMIQVRVGGAYDDDRRVDVIGAPTFEEGEEVFLFLMRFDDQDTGKEYYGIRGLGQGAYRMPMQPEGPSQVLGLHATGEPDLAMFEARVRDMQAKLERK